MEDGAVVLLAHVLERFLRLVCRRQGNQRVVVATTRTVHDLLLIRESTLLFLNGLRLVVVYFVGLDKLTLDRAGRLSQASVRAISGSAQDVDGVLNLEITDEGTEFFLPLHFGIHLSLIDPQLGLRSGLVAALSFNIEGINVFILVL